MTIPFYLLPLIHDNCSELSWLIHRFNNPQARSTGSYVRDWVARTRIKLIHFQLRSGRSGVGAVGSDQTLMVRFTNHPVIVELS
jgi:hypothetical protein